MDKRREQKFFAFIHSHSNSNCNKYLALDVIALISNRLQLVNVSCQFGLALIDCNCMSQSKLQLLFHVPLLQAAFPINSSKCYLFNKCLL